MSNLRVQGTVGMIAQLVTARMAPMVSQRLPRVQAAMPQVRSPACMRCLSIVRTVRRAILADMTPRRTPIAQPVRRATSYQTISQRRKHAKAAILLRQHVANRRKRSSGGCRFGGRRLQLH